MCNRSTTIDQIVYDRLRIRLIETKWVDTLEKFIFAALLRRNEDGQDLTTLKFEELYQELARRSRDVLSDEIESELHEKFEDYVLSNIDGCDNPYTMNLSEPNSPNAANVDTPSDGSSDMLNDIFDST